LASGQKFTRIPKAEQLIAQGVSPEAFVTYCALSDHASNRNGLCWPRMDTLAARIGRSVRTVQRHIHHLASCGVVQLVNRRRTKKGFYSSYLFRVLAVAGFAGKHLASSTGHERPAGRGGSYIRRTKRVNNTPSIPPKSEKDYEWFFTGTESEEKAAREQWEAHLRCAQEAL
jgi:hypothetical protein